MTTKEQLREKYEQESGIRCITPKGDGDIRYVEALEDMVTVSPSQTKEQLREEFDRQRSGKIIQPSFSEDQKAYIFWLESEIEKRDKEIEELEDMVDKFRGIKKYGDNSY